MLEVITPVERSQISRLSDKMIMIERQQSCSEFRRVTDVFGDLWSVAVAKDLPKGQVFLHRHGEAIELSGTIGLFVPPYSVLDWGFAGKSILWNAVLIEGKPPIDSPAKACLFALAENQFPRSDFEWLDLLTNMKLGAIVAKEEKVTPLVLKIKEYLDHYSLESFSLNEMANNLNCSPGSMGRAFRQCYGVTPVYYRNQLRVFRASLMIFKGFRVADVGHDVGFHDLGRFNKQFKQKMNAVPSQFIGDSV